MSNCTFIAACLECFGIRNVYDIYIRRGAQLIRVEAETIEDLKRQLSENRSHLVAFLNEEEKIKNLGSPIWPTEENIIAYTQINIENPNLKGITV